MTSSFQSHSNYSNSSRPKAYRFIFFKSLTLKWIQIQTYLKYFSTHRVEKNLRSFHVEDFLSKDLFIELNLLFEPVNNIYICSASLLKAIEKKVNLSETKCPYISVHMSELFHKAALRIRFGILDISGFWVQRGARAAKIKSFNKMINATQSWKVFNWWSWKEMISFKFW